MIERCVAARTLALQPRQLTCRTILPADCQIHGDAFLLQQAVLNLLDNAMAFSPPGGEIIVDLSKRDEQVVIEVRDQGAGAPDYALPQLFDRFYSLPRPATGKKSTGLGLALVREVARLHGGEAHFANHPDGGALVTLTLSATRKPPP